MMQQLFGDDFATETARAITIHQPWASLIMLADDHLHAKRIENRNWATTYRGPLVIHAGKSRQWLNTWPHEMPAEMPYGAILGVVDVLACLRFVDIAAGNVPDEFNWTRTHEHAEGPWCWVLGNVRRLEKPVPYTGAQGFWMLSRALLVGLI